MITALLIVFVLAAVAIVHWREVRLSRRPVTWPTNLPLKRQVRLASRFLKSDGWQLLENNIPMNIFIRAKRGNLWLAMMIQNQETLSLPTLITDTINKHAGKEIILGILSRELLSGELKADAERNGIYVISAAELKDVSSHIRRASLKRKQQASTAFGVAEAETPPATTLTH